MVQQLFWWKYHFQGIPNQHGKSRIFQGEGEYDKHPLELKFQVGGSNAKTPYFLKLHITAFTVW